MERNPFVARLGGPACGVLFFLFVTCLCQASRDMKDQATAIDPNCGDSDNGIECVCSEPPAGTDRVAEFTPDASLSESKNTISIQCPNQYEFRPSEKSMVCTVGKDGNVTDLEQCGSAKKEEINGLLNPGPEPPLQWSESGTSAKKRSLTLPQPNFPLIDKRFFVGCLSEGARDRALSRSNKKSCVVNVQVEAKKSSLHENVLTCGYGANSNTEKTPVATLTSNNNALTIVCGSEGQLHPTGTPTTAFLCDISTEKCSTAVELTDVFPSFKEAWITVEGETGTNKLVIPEDGFPEEDKMIMLGCSLKTVSGNDNKKKENTTVQEEPTCKVKVVIPAGGRSSATASGPSSPMFAFAVGFLSLVVSGAYLTSH
ncbi:SRS domain-containing protein [Neospora caninum Liverpool]|uniref:SRS domain-containing protein n=1 Tax=Neospora caninum (strain Liverpool) TaxID=572307 RepID=F0VIY3_NEOCL|nr:SRS domain-containing protein [Neospora caninum Liverpool]CBZ53694.1 SRS domain-containing protein [Neospora caninum Liverpool]CEL67685.1 TPA: SRS domain-containing protein [Neospora caninum Liverpool]|eukprot:XP_003883726.1 SRS domain-containing protein [Neospora caninum Liverpool]